MASAEENRGCVRENQESVFWPELMCLTTHGHIFQCIWGQKRNAVEGTAYKRDVEQWYQGTHQAKGQTQVLGPTNSNKLPTNEVFFLWWHSVDYTANPVSTMNPTVQEESRPKDTGYASHASRRGVTEHLVISDKGEKIGEVCMHAFNTTPAGGKSNRAGQNWPLIYNNTKNILNMKSYSCERTSTHNRNSYDSNTYM